MLVDYMSRDTSTVAGLTNSIIIYIINSRVSQNIKVQTAYRRQYMTRLK